MNVPIFQIWLVIGTLLASLPAVAFDQPVPLSPLQRRLEALILPEVKFREADLVGALRYLQKKAQEQQPKASVPIPIYVDLPDSFRPRYELTLEMRAVPYWEALRYLGEQAGVELSTDGGAIMVRPLGSASAAQAAAKEQKTPPPELPPSRGLTGVLGKLAEPVTSGVNTHRSTAGVIQPEKSGYMPRRSLGGWSGTRDPRNGYGINCIDVGICPAGKCGCYICCCHPPTKEAKKSTP